jgi:CHAT domain-containing protein/tetratricopeptide (TPR) repeat protein
VYWVHVVAFTLALFLPGLGIANAQTDQEVIKLSTQLVELYKQGRFAEAAPLGEKLLEMRLKVFGAEHLETAIALTFLGTVYRSQGRIEEAEDHYVRALAVRKKLLPANHAEIATSINFLAMVRVAQGRYGEAEDLFKEALRIREAGMPAAIYGVAVSFNNLGELYRMLARHGEAETALRRALELLEAALGTSEHTDFAASLNNLGLLLEAMGRYEDAAKIHQRALAIRERHLPAGHGDVALSLNNLAIAYHRMARQVDAERTFERSIRILKQSPSTNPGQLATTINNLAEVYKARGRYAEAEPLLRDSLKMRERVLPEGHPDVGQSLSNLGSTYVLLGKYDAAEAVLRRAVSLSEATMPAGHPQVAISISNLASLEVKRGRWPSALALARHATALSIQRAGGGQKTADPGGARYWHFLTHVWAATRVAEMKSEEFATLADEAFRVAQWAMQTEAGGALSRMAARFGSGKTFLAQLVRERQDLEYQRQAADKRLITAMSLPAERRGDTDARARRDLNEVNERVGAIDARLRAEFPDYVSLVSPEPLAVGAVASLLRPNEALLQFVTDKEQVFSWAILPGGKTRWLRTPISRETLLAKINTLRCGVDWTQWKWIATLDDPERQRRCLTLTAVSTRPGDNEPLPFRLDVAHELYSTLLGPFSELVNGRDLIVVADGVLGALPLHALVKENPRTGAGINHDYRSIAWLGKLQAVTVLPSVSSLRSLRQVPRPDRALNSFVGFGNPLLIGPEGNDHSAWSSLRCAAIGGQKQGRTATPVRSIQRLFRGGFGNVEELRRLAPLPETAGELCDVARSLGAREDDVYLGDRATEAVVKNLSASGKLADAQVVHFATHGLLPGNVSQMEQMLAEPALVMTPPGTARGRAELEIDDGLLTASEIAQLRMNADWVVLSACNTAGAEKAGGESLSGLARAFFYAGARALLVSQWEVDSDAAVKLTAGAFAAMRASVDRKTPIGRAEALRRSMSALIESGGAREAHPAHWAPFLVVGEGAP